MKVRVDDALLVLNNRNNSNMKRADLSRNLWPGLPRQVQYNYMFRFCNGIRNPKIEEVIQIAGICGVDPHFMLGLPSVHDKFFELITNRRAELQSDFKIKYTMINGNT